MLAGDNPVGSADDLLGRSVLAKTWAKLVDRVPTPQGMVFAVTGPWGSGKTSLLTMMREDLESWGRLVVDFNPWLFSGTEQLIEHFFDETANQLDVGGEDEKLLKVAGALRTYGTLFGALKAVPIVGAASGAAADAAANVGKLIQETRKKDVYTKRRLVEDALQELDDPIIVIVDDVDRLTAQEIRDVMRLVRLTGSFSNLVYVLAFDRARIEQALNEDGADGRLYLEKIVQVVWAVPQPPRHLVRSLLNDALSVALQDWPEQRLNTSRLQIIYYEIIEPLIRNIRDVRRLMASVSST